MKAKQVEKLLSGVMNNFLLSIKDEEIKETLKNKSFISGGCIPSMLMGEWVNDYDIYLYDEFSAKNIKNYFEKLPKKPKQDKTDKFHVKLITENAINLSDKIQIITKFYGTPEKVVENFDWQHIKSWYDCSNEKLNLTNDVYKLIVEKELIYTGSAYPLSSLLRLKKYLKKGWNVSNQTIIMIVFDILKVFGTNNIQESEIQEYIDENLIEINNIKRTMPVEEEDVGEDTPNSKDDNDSVNDIFLDTDTLVDQLNGVDPLSERYRKLREEQTQKIKISRAVEILWRD